MEDQKGILVAQVSKDSPADKAGLKQGDVIVEFDRKSVDQTGTFRNDVALKKPGTKIKTVILRDGKRKTLSVNIGKLPDDETATSENPHNLDKIGMTVQDITPELARQFGLERNRGVVITNVSPNSVAALANVKPGGIILEVNRQPVKNLKDFKKALAEVPENNVVLLLIQKGAYARYVALKTD